MRLHPPRMGGTILLAFILISAAKEGEGATRRVPLDYPTLTEAISASTNGDSVLVAPGVYAGAGFRDLDPGGRSLVIRSEAGAEATILDAQADGMDPHRHFIFQSWEGRDFVLEGFTLRGGVEAGGAILCVGASPTIRDCIIQGNRSEQGGGILIVEGSPDLVGLQIIQNDANLGGGISCIGGSPMLRRCRIAANTSHDGGGGIAAELGADLFVEECTITGNRGIWEGGAIYFENSIALLTACTLSGNRILAVGGAIYARASEVYLERTIAWGDCAIGSPEIRADSAAVVRIACCDIDPAKVGGVGSVEWLANNMVADPLFCDPAPCGEAPTLEGDYRLQDGSPCLPPASPCGLRVGASGAGCSPSTVEAPGHQRASIAVHPNPGAGRFEFRIDGLRRGGEYVRILDVSGRLVAALAVTATGTALWDGRGTDGQAAPAGVYYARTATEEGDGTVRFVFVR